MRDDLSVPFDKDKSHPSALTTDKYGLSKIEVLKACISREFILMKRNLPVYKFRMMQVIISRQHFLSSILIFCMSSNLSFCVMFPAFGHGNYIYDPVSTYQYVQEYSNGWWNLYGSSLFFTCYTNI